MARTAVQAILLAAGASSRFKSETSKLLFTLCGQAMILFPVKILHALGIPTTLVIGYKKEQIKRLLEEHGCDSLSFVEQAEQRGTGDAVAATTATWHADHIFVMNGDMPLIQAELVANLIEQHIQSDAAVSFVTAHNTDPSTGAYGRIVHINGIMSIVEARDFTGNPQTDCCINAGIYIFRREFLKQYIDTLHTHANSRELYLTDLIEIASRQHLRITTITAPFDQVRGVNTLQELWAAEQIKRAEIIEHYMQQGVRFTYAQSTHVDVDVVIGAGTCIEAGVQLLSGTRIGKHVTIGSFSCIRNSVIGEHVTVQSHSIITDATIGASARIGPFAHIHNNSSIGSESVIGNFVEVTTSSIAQKTKIKHLSYIGNAHIGSNVNIGAGTIIANYNGVSKQTTIIEDNASIGCNNSLVAPITIEQYAMTGAGSVITEDVPAHALAIARAQQVNKEGYATRLRASLSIAGVRML